VLSPVPSRTPALAPAPGNNKQAFSLDIYGWMTARLRFMPRLFFIGIAIGLFICVVAGRFCASRNIYSNFHRFHKYISPASLFYPTVSQMRAIVNRAATPTQIVVIAGGNSIFNGIGQTEQKLWTENLQNRLGDRYKVFNFALPSADPFELGYWAAESLLKENRKVIYITTCFPGQPSSPVGSPTYSYSYWDAKEKSLLLRNTDREQAAEGCAKGFLEKEKVKWDELKIRAKLDSLLYFEDLWTTVAYKSFFSVWTGLTAQSPWVSRKSYHDINTEPILAPDRFHTKEQLKGVLEYNQTLFVEKSIKPAPDFWRSFGHQVRCTVPSGLRKNCLVTLSAHAPAILAQMSEIRKKQEHEGFVLSETAWRAAGFNCTDFEGKLNSADYLDGRHLLAGGGNKLAELVAPQVKQIARSLNYE
jgi:hypothetical protein